MTTTEEAWEFQERLAYAGLKDGLCFLDLRRRVEALEARATPAPEPAPAADRPLWAQMQEAWNDSGTFDFSAAHRYAAEIDAVADWLDARAVGVDAVVALHAEARRAREGA